MTNESPFRAFLSLAEGMVPTMPSVELIVDCAANAAPQISRMVNSIN